MYDEYLIVKNPDTRIRTDVIGRLKANNGYCPSKLEHSPDTKCCCKQLREKGECACGLFIAVPCRTITEGE